MGEPLTAHVEILTGRSQRITHTSAFEHAELSLTSTTGRSMRLVGATGTVDVGGGGTDGDLTVRDRAGAATVTIDGDTSRVTAGAVVLDGRNASVSAGGGGVNGRVAVRGKRGQELVTIDSAAVVDVGGNGTDGAVRIRRADGREQVTLDGRTGNVALFGDVEMWGADVAEQFDVVDPAIADGTVVVLCDDGGVAACTQAYDRRVAGIVSGAGDRRPAFVLDRRPPRPGGSRLAVAVAGKAWCLAEAEDHPIGVGDLLTTSSAPGRACRAVDPIAAFGAVLGKALTSLPHGRGEVLVLVALS